MVSTLYNGYTLQFQCRPPTFSGIKSRIKVTLVKYPDRSLVLRQEVAFLLGKGAIEVIEPREQLDGFYSTYFLEPKKDGGIRPILDLGLNQFLKVLPFQLCVADGLHHSGGLVQAI